MNRMKILQVNKLYYPEIGGIEKTLQQISEGLDMCDDVELKVLVCQKKGRASLDLINGVKVYRAGSLGVVSSVPISFSFLWKFRQMAKKADIVQFHLPFPLGDLACLLSGYRGKVVTYWHSDVVKQKVWLVFYRPIMEYLLRRSDCILVGAKGVARGSKYLSPYFDKCKVVPFAVEDDILESGRAYLDSNGYHRKHEKICFLFIGRLVYYKGCKVLVEAFSQMNKRKEAELVILGGGAMRSELEEQCRVLGIDHSVTFTGNVSPENMHRYFEEADVFVLPSIERSEAFALVQLEAMSYGLPVINTNLPSGVPEVSIHMQTGLTTEPGDATELAEAMDWLMDHEEERVNMGIQARQRVEQTYTQKQMIDNLMQVYRTLMSET